MIYKYYCMIPIETLSHYQIYAIMIKFMKLSPIGTRFFSLWSYGTSMIQTSDNSNTFWQSSSSHRSSTEDKLFHILNLFFTENLSMSRIVSAERQAVASRSPGITSLYGSPSLKRTHFLQWKIGLIKRVVSLEGYKLVIFYDLSASDIFPHKRGQVTFGGSGLIREVRWPLVGVAL